MEIKMPIEYPTTRLMRFGYVTTTNGAITWQTIHAIFIY